MSIEIATHYVEGYRANIELLLQQKGSRLRDCVRLESQRSEREFYDRIGPTEALDVTTRHADTPHVDTSHDRRAVTMLPSDWSDFIDRQDQVRLLADPTSAYAMNAIYAMGRKQDRRIIDAAVGTAYAGKEGTTPVAFPAGQTIAVDYVESGGATNSGLTVAKLRRARELLDEAEVDDEEPQYIAVTAKQINDLLRSTEVTSADFNTVKALVTGQVDSFMGFTFRRVSSKLLRKNGSNRSVLAWARSGLLLALGQEPTVRITERPDKRYARQIYVSMDSGAVRMEEKKVVEVLCLES